MSGTQSNPGVGPETILFLHSSDDLYGSDLVLLRIVQGLDRKRFKPLVVLPQDMLHVGLLSRELSASQVEVLHLPLAILRRRYLKPSGILSLLGLTLRGTWAIRRLVRERNVQLIHGFTTAVAAAPIAAKLLHLPLVMHVHEILLEPRFLRRALHALAVRSADKVICISEAVRKNVLEDEPGFDAKLQVIYNGIPQPAPGKRSLDQMRAALGVPLRGTLIGTIGRISPWKGQDLLLRAAALVVKRRQDCHFVILGGVFDNETRHLDRIMKLRLELHLEAAVTLSGFRKDAREMIPCFDVFVLPSTLPEPFGLVVLEAMTQAKPVIATAHGGPLEIVLDGVTGLLVPPADPEMLAQACEELLDAPERRLAMGEAGRIRAAEVFGLARYLDEIQSCYSSILGRVV